MAAGGAANSGKTYSFKVVLLGEGCVGKTSLVLRYCENKFNDKHITTLQVRGACHRAVRRRGGSRVFPGSSPPTTSPESGVIAKQRWRCDCNRIR